MHVTVVAKAPLPGRVKTRLCPPLTPPEAAAVAAASLTETLRAASASAADRKILAFDRTPGHWSPPGFDFVRQPEGSLDIRLEAIWAAVGGPGVQIGMDTPQLTAALLNDALAAVAAGDAVVGLAEDGGWWLVGLPWYTAGSFAGIRTSTARTGADQVERLRSLGYRVRFAPVLRDIDTYPDLLAVADRVPALNPSTVAVLAET